MDAVLACRGVALGALAGLAAAAGALAESGDALVDAAGAGAVRDVCGAVLAGRPLAALLSPAAGSRAPAAGGEAPPPRRTRGESAYVGSPLSVEVSSSMRAGAPADAPGGGGGGGGVPPAPTGAAGGAPPAPITDVCVLLKGDEVPEGFEKIERTPSGAVADVSRNGARVFLAVSRRGGGKAVTGLALQRASEGEFVPPTYRHAPRGATALAGDLTGGGGGGEGLYLLLRRGEGAPLSGLTVLFAESEGGGGAREEPPPGYVLLSRTVLGGSGSVSASPHRLAFVAARKDMRHVARLSPPGLRALDVGDPEVAAAAAAAVAAAVPPSPPSVDAGSPTRHRGSVAVAKRLPARDEVATPSPPPPPAPRAPPPPAPRAPPAGESGAPVGSSAASVASSDTASDGREERPAATAAAVAVPPAEAGGGGTTPSSSTRPPLIRASRGASVLEIVDGAGGGSEGEDDDDGGTPVAAEWLPGAGGLAPSATTALVAPLVYAAYSGEPRTVAAAVSGLAALVLAGWWRGGGDPGQLQVRPGVRGRV